MARRVTDVSRHGPARHRVSGENSEYIKSNEGKPRLEVVSRSSRYPDLYGWEISALGRREGGSGDGKKLLVRSWSPRTAMIYKS